MSIVKRKKSKIRNRLKPKGAKISKVKINREWHKKNKMPKNPTLEERIKWHVEHHQMCNCRPIPESIQREIKKPLS